MSEHLLEESEPSAGVRSGVKIEENSKGFPQIKLAVYEGTTQSEIQECSDLAYGAYMALKRRLGR